VKKADNLQDTIKLDELDFKILEALLDDGRVKFKDLARALNTDERMVSSRLDRLIENNVIRKFTIDVDWSIFGFNVEAYVGTRTGIGENLRKDLFDFFKSHPRIVSVFSTVGAYEYILHALGRDLQDFRSEVCNPLEPLTAGLSTSIISEQVKPTNYKPLLRLIAENSKAK
jgi:DNA-binding Lrp family transcriptional regulator